MEVGRSARDGAKSVVRHGCLFTQPAGVIMLKISKEPAGLVGRNKDFSLVFVL